MIFDQMEWNFFHFSHRIARTRTKKNIFFPLAIELFLKDIFFISLLLNKKEAVSNHVKSYGESSRS